MSEDREMLRRVDWLEVCPGLRLFAALRMALHFRALVLAALAIVFTSAGWQTCGKLFSDTQNLQLQAQIERNSLWPWQRPMLEPGVENLGSLEGWKLQTPLFVAWREISAPFQQIYRSDITATQFAYWLLCALWTLAVWAFFGGVLTRLAAVCFARQENVAWKELAGFVRPRWGSYVAAVLFPILGTFVIAAFLALLGLAMKTDSGLLVTGVLWPLVLLAGFMMAFLLVGLFVGWPLMASAISTEGTDSFGALSHSYSYAYQRPVHYLLYVTVATLIGLLGWYLVWIFADLIIALSYWGVSWGTGQERLLELTNASEMGTSVGNAGLRLVHFWNGCVLTLALAFVFSYFWSASTVIYFLLRRLVDATEVDEVFLPDEDQLHSLPPLKTGADGVPEPNDEAPVGEESEHREG